MELRGKKAVETGFVKKGEEGRVCVWGGGGGVAGGATEVPFFIQEGRFSHIYASSCLPIKKKKKKKREKNSKTKL